MKENHSKHIQRLLKKATTKNVNYILVAGPKTDLHIFHNPDVNYTITVECNYEVDETLKRTSTKPTSYDVAIDTYFRYTHKTLKDVYTDIEEELSNIETL